MARGYLWCRHCGEPHPFGLQQCPTTQKALETRIHRKQPNQGAPDGGVIEGKYRIRQLLGEGASGRVFLAEDLSNKGKAVAIKIHKGELGRKGRRLEQEGKLALSVRHPNVARVLNYGRLPDGRPYIVMEALLKGQTLQKLLTRVRALDEALALAVASQLLSGLEAVHDVGIVHRDLKPSNVFLTKTNDQYPTVKILDFGLAKPPPDKALVFTRPGYTFGTPGYIAPELFQGEAPTPRSDIWAVGVMLFEMLSGMRPFRGEREAGTPYAVVTEGPRSLATCAPYVPARLVSIVETALSTDPRSRFPTVGDFRERLQSFAIELQAEGHYDSLRPRSQPSVLPVIEYFSSTPTGSSHDTKTITIANERTTTEATITTTPTNRRARPLE